MSLNWTPSKKLIAEPQQKFQITKCARATWSGPKTRGSSPMPFTIWIQAEGWRLLQSATKTSLKHSKRKPFCANSYSQYKRKGVTEENYPANGRCYKITNQYIVPFNSYLLLRFNCHLNIEVYSAISAVKICTNISTKVSVFKNKYHWIMRVPGDSQNGSEDHQASSRDENNALSAKFEYINHNIRIYQTQPDKIWVKLWAIWSKWISKI